MTDGIKKVAVAANDPAMLELSKAANAYCKLLFEQSLKMRPEERPIQDRQMDVVTNGLAGILHAVSDNMGPVTVPLAAQIGALLLQVLRDHTQPVQ